MHHILTQGDSIVLSAVVHFISPFEDHLKLHLEISTIVLSAYV